MHTVADKKKLYINYFGNYVTNIEFFIHLEE